jgi:AcrR family transcriptional regulator
VATRATARPVERTLARRREKYQGEVDRLVDAAVAVMRDRGTADPTVSDILAEAGLSTTAFYRHFPTKDDLFLTLLLHAGETCRSYVEHRMASAGGPVPRIVVWVESMFDLLRTPAALAANRPFFLAHTRLTERFPDELDANLDLLVEPLAAAIGDARAHAGLTEVDARRDALAVHQQVYGALTERAARRQLTDPSEVDAVVDFCLRAVLGTSVDRPGARPPA